MLLVLALKLNHSYGNTQSTKIFHSYNCDLDKAVIIEKSQEIFNILQNSTTAEEVVNGMERNLISTLKTTEIPKIHLIFTKNMP